MRYRCFQDWESAGTFLRTEKGCDLCGIVAQSPNTSGGSAPPPSGSAASALKAASPRAAAAGSAVAENAHPEDGDVEDNTAPAGCCDSAPTSSSTPTSPEHQKLPAVEQHADGAVTERPGERSSSSTAPQSSSMIIEQAGVEGSQADREWYNKDDRAAVAASIAVRRRPFRRSTAFVVGHRNRLEEEALRVCDFLVHVEQVTGDAGGAAVQRLEVALNNLYIHTARENAKSEFVVTTKPMWVCFLASHAPT